MGTLVDKPNVVHLRPQAEDAQTSEAGIVVQMLWTPRALRYMAFGHKSTIHSTYYYYYLHMHTPGNEDLTPARPLELEVGTVSVTCRPAINCSGYYATLTLTVAGELAAVVDVLTYDDRLDPIRAEALVWRVREALTSPESYGSGIQVSNGGGG